MFTAALFKKFTDKENISGVVQMKHSDVKKLKTKICDDYPYIRDYWDEILPKKETPKIIRCVDHVEILANCNGEPLFFKERNSVYVPCLRVLHMYPFLLACQQVDRGAIKFVLGGANVMCPGLTSKGGKLFDCPAGIIVAITAEGKEHALAIGIMRLSSADIVAINKGVAIDVIHYANDGLWNMKPVK